MNSSALTGSPIELSPLAILIIPVVVAAVLAAVWWMVRRVIASIDKLGVRLDSQNAKLDTLGTRLTVVETNQGWTMETAERQDRNTRKTARKVGVLPSQLEATVQRPTYE
jgi:hypothetical protein